MVPALSPSRAVDFLQCPLLYRFRALDRLPEPASPAAARGILVHAVLERLFDLPADRRTREAAAGLLPEQWARLIADSPQLAQLVDESGPVLLQAWFDEALRLLERWFTLEDPSRLEPAARELYVETEIDGLTLRGYLDRLDVAPDGRMRVVDYKTGHAPTGRAEALARFQLTFYALVLWRLHGRVPARLQLVCLGDGVLLTDEPREADLLAVERKLKAVWRAIARAAQEDDFRPRRSRRCTWCAHRGQCPAWGAPPAAAPAVAAVARASTGSPSRHAERTGAGTPPQSSPHAERTSAGAHRSAQSSRRR